ncbi:hypothetical protein LWI29_012662 [Acer saccharum]|uniref:GBF-interacting protein 1 N-terminal domain-containing protein n=1 Tax=Acer saccharum TaxID=4024 RepID=A0AA39SG20_ACESA|nr:hypothetical protein LWI29_012662 [Acer saccharum]
MGSDSKKSGGNVQGGGGGGCPIPAEAKKIVQNLKEIVGKNFTDAEIYAVLLDCNMDPDDAVNLLLSQDTFHEVKSKRERRKEVKETQESRSRNNNSASNWGVRLGSEHAAGWTGSTENNYNELGKASYKRENVSAAPSVSSSSSYVYRATGKILNEKPLPHSDSSNADNRRQSTGASDTITSSMQPSSGLQPSWSGVSKGHVSMADIVKMGTQLSKGLQMSSEVSYAPQYDASSNLPHYCIKSSQISTTPDSEMHQDLYSYHPSNVSEIIHESGMTAGQHGFDNKWPVYEHQTAASGSSLFDASGAIDADVYSNQSSLHSDRAYMSRNSQSQELQVSERDVDSQNLNSNYNGSDSAASRQIFVNSSGGASNDDSLKETSSYVSHSHMHNHQEGISNSSDLPFPSYSASFSDDVLSAVSSAAANLQQLNIGRVEPAKPLTEDNSAVVLPIYLQAFAADCSHLSFGTYKSGVASAPIAPISSNSSKSDLEVSAVVDGSSALHWNIRNSGYQDDEQLGFMHDTHRAAADSRKYESQVPSQQEFMKQDIPETTHGDQYMATSSVPDSSNKSTQQSNSNLAYARDPNAMNLPLPNEMLSYAKSIPSPSGLLASTVQSLRARDSSPFLAAQPIPLKYSAAMPSLNSPISMSEVLNSSAYSLHPPASQALPGSNLAKGNVLPQHLSVHPYAQPEMSLRELANMTGYPSMPQSQSYVPSALPQPYPDSSAFHDSRAGMNYNLSQYRSGAAMNSMHLPKGSNAGYGSFVGSSTNLPGSFLHNLSTSHTGTGASYEDLLRSQIKDGNVIPQQQNSGFYGRDFGNSTRTMSALPESAYYNLLGQNPQHAGYQQSQQASQHYETLGGGYPKMYRSRTGTGREQQQQNLGDYTLNDSQDTTSNQFNQIWGHRY